MKKLIFYFIFFPLFISAYTNIAPTYCDDTKRIYLYSDILFWKTFEGGLDYLYDDRITDNQPNGLAGDVKRAIYSWQFGFRVGAKYNFDYGNWKLDAQYGLIAPNNSEEIFTPDNKLMSSTFPLTTSFNLQKAKSKIRLRSHFANLLLERTFKASETIKLGLITGLMGTWMKRTWDLKFFGSSSYTRVVKPSWHFKGAGIKTGLDFDWILKHHFSWSGQSNIACLFGNYDSWMIVYDNTENNKFENSHLDDFRLATNLQFLMGPSWERAFNNFDLRVFANYEMNVWFNLAQVNRSSYQNNTSNPQSRFTNNILQMHGITLNLLINF